MTQQASDAAADLFVRKTSMVEDLRHYVHSGDLFAGQQTPGTAAQDAFYVAMPPAPLYQLLQALALGRAISHREGYVLRRNEVRGMVRQTARRKQISATLTAYINAAASATSVTMTLRRLLCPGNALSRCLYSEEGNNVVSWESPLVFLNGMNNAVHAMSPLLLGFYSMLHDFGDADDVPYRLKREADALRLTRDGCDDQTKYPRSPWDAAREKPRSRARSEQQYILLPSEALTSINTLFANFFASNPMHGWNRNMLLNAHGDVDQQVLLTLAPDPLPLRHSDILTREETAALVRFRDALMAAYTVLAPLFIAYGGLLAKLYTNDPTPRVTPLVNLLRPGAPKGRTRYQYDTSAHGEQVSYTWWQTAGLPEGMRRSRLPRNSSKDWCRHCGLLLHAVGRGPWGEAPYDISWQAQSECRIRNRTSLHPDSFRAEPLLR